MEKTVIYDITPPNAPTGLSIKGGCNQLHISWDSAQDQQNFGESSGVKGYVLEYTLSDTGEVINNIFLNQSTAPSHIITNLCDNEKVNLTIKTIDYAGNFSINFSFFRQGVPTT